MNYAVESLARLRETAGRAGVGQRLSKKAFREAERLPDADAAQLVERLSTAQNRPNSASRGR